MAMVWKSRKPNILLSHAHLRTSKSKANQLLPILLALSRAGKINLLVDSGAFTVYSTGKSIPVEEYIEWCKKYYEDAWQYIALDVIGNPQATRDNLDKMVQAGLKPMPVLVMGEPLESVKEFVKINEHICVAGGVTQPIEFMKKRYASAHAISGGVAKIHGLGFVKLPHFWQTTLFSVDSSSWMAGQRWGIGTQYDRVKGLYNGVRLSQVIAGKVKLNPNQARHLLMRGITPSTLTAEMYSGQFCYVGSESTTASVELMKHSWEMGEKGKANYFMAVAKIEDVEMIVASFLVLSKNGKHWKYAEWKKICDDLINARKTLPLQDLIKVYISKLDLCV